MLIRLLCKLMNIEMGTFVHATEGEMVCASINPKIPYFNAPIYLENKVGSPTLFCETKTDGHRQR